MKIKKYFGNSIVHDYSTIKAKTIDVHSSLYEGSIVDDVELVKFEDESVALQSDISILKGLNANSSPALAEALSVRMQLRKGSGKQDLKDEDILNVLKSRKCQDITELASYKEAIKAQFGKDLTDYDMERLFEKLQNETDDEKEQESDAS